MYPKAKGNFLGKFEDHVGRFLRKFEVRISDVVLQMGLMIQGARREKQAEDLRDLVRENMGILSREWKG